MSNKFFVEEKALLGEKQISSLKAQQATLVSQLQTLQTELDVVNADLQDEEVKHARLMANLRGERGEEFGTKRIAVEGDDESMPSVWSDPKKDLSQLTLADARQTHHTLDKIFSMTRRDLARQGGYLIDNGWLDHPFHLLPCPFGTSWKKMIEDSMPPGRTTATELEWQQWWILAIYHIAIPRQGVYTAEARGIQNGDIRNWDAATMFAPTHGLLNPYIQKEGINQLQLRQLAQTLHNSLTPDQRRLLSLVQTNTSNTGRTGQPTNANGPPPLHRNSVQGTNGIAGGMTGFNLSQGTPVAPAPSGVNGAANWMRGSVNGTDHNQGQADVFQNSWSAAVAAATDPTNASQQTNVNPNTGGSASNNGQPLQFNFFPPSNGN